MERVFKLYYAPLCRTVNRMLNDRDAAEDIVQDVLLKIWNQRAALTITSSVKAYLFRSAINSALNYLEKSKRTVDWETVQFAEPSVNNAEDELHASEMQARIQTATDALPPACRAVFMLSRHEQMSYKEIAETLQISSKTVENQMGKALKHFRHYLAGYVKNVFTFL